jgi:hypothetical protein
MSKFRISLFNFIQYKIIPGRVKEWGRERRDGRDLNQSGGLGKSPKVPHRVSPTKHRGLENHLSPVLRGRYNGEGAETGEWEGQDYIDNAVKPFFTPSSQNSLNTVRDRRNGFSKVSVHFCFFFRCFYSLEKFGKKGILCLSVKSTIFSAFLL